MTTEEGFMIVWLIIIAYSLGYIRGKITEARETLNG